MEVTLLPQPYESQFLTFFFVYVRVSVAVFTLPVISNEAVTGAVRAGIAFWVTIVLIGPIIGLSEAELPWLMPLTTEVFKGVVHFMLAIVMEVLIGMALGFIASMFLQTIGLAGEIIGQQAGFSAASVFDPITGVDVMLLAQVNMLFATLLFITIDGPGTTLMVLAKSFEVIGPGEGFVWMSYADAGLRTLVYDAGEGFALVSMLYMVAVQIALPMIGSMVLISVTEAFLARSVPQLNIMVVGFAIRITMSLIILISWMMFMIPKYKAYLQQIAFYSDAFLFNVSTP